MIRRSALRGSLTALPLLAALTLPLGALAADVGIAAKKLLIKEKGGGTLLFLAKDPGVVKGAGAADKKGPQGLVGEIAAFVGDPAGSVSGAWTLPEPWKKNTEKVAVLAHKTAEGSLRKAKLKNGKNARVLVKTLGDEGASFFSAAPEALDGLTVVLTVANANDASTHRMCTRFAAADGARIKVKDGRKGRSIVAKNGTATACPPPGPGCDPINQVECLLPYPSSHYLVADPATDTGFRLDVPQEGIPRPNGPEVSNAIVNGRDGFNTGIQMLMHFWLAKAHNDL
jgi:hypothetical protein